MALTFILNDETKTNSHGFRVRNLGIDLARFRNNPVLLDFHMAGSAAVIGKWENIRIEGALLKADAVFDEKDETAMRIKGKVEDGFIKGASLGLDGMNIEFQLVDGVPTAVRSEVTEASIVPIPSNANALKLYNDKGVEMSKKDVQLSLSSITELIKNKSNMKQIMLTVAAMVALGFEKQEVTESDALSAAIEKLHTDFEAAKVALSAERTAKETLQSQLDAVQNAKVDELVNLAIQQGKIDATKKEDFIKLAKSDFEMAKGILDGIPVKKDLSASNSGGAGNGVVKTEEDFMKLSADEKLAFKENHPEEYKQIFA